MSFKEISFSFKEISFFVGFFGDILLQTTIKIIPENKDIAGLRPYFKQHGRIESVFIASGLMFLAAYIFQLTKFKLNYINLFLFGGFLDILFRFFRIFPSLDTYYIAMNPVESFIWAGIPMIIPLFILNSFY